MINPAAGTYKVCVNAYGSSGDQPMTHKLSSWIVTPADVGGKFAVAVPGKVVAGNNSTIGMSWSGLAADSRYVGGAQFRDAGGVVRSSTILRVDTGVAAVPLAEVERAVPKKKN